MRLKTTSCLTYWFYVFSWNFLHFGSRYLGCRNMTARCTMTVMNAVYATAIIIPHRFRVKQLHVNKRPVKHERLKNSNSQQRTVMKRSYEETELLTCISIYIYYSGNVQPWPAHAFSPSSAAHGGVATPPPPPAVSFLSVTELRNKLSFCLGCSE